MCTVIGCNPSAAIQLRLQLKLQHSTAGRYGTFALTISIFSKTIVNHS